MVRWQHHRESVNGSGHALTAGLRPVVIVREGWLMSPTWLEILVAVLLLWIAWRIALLLTPWIINRWRGRRKRADVVEQRGKLPLLKQKVEHNDSE